MFFVTDKQSRHRINNIKDLVFSLSLAGDDDTSIFTVFSVNTVLELER